MKGKQLLLVLVLLAAVGGAALYLQKRDSATWSDSATATDEKVLNFPLNDVAQVTIRSGDAEVNLVKKDDAWRVAERADYPADFAKVAGLLRKLWELRPVQNVKAGQSQLARLELIEPSGANTGGTLIELKSAAGDRLSALLLGKRQQADSTQAGGVMGIGRYVLAPQNPQHVFLISETLDEAQPKPEQWLDRDFLKVANPKSIALKGKAPGMNWTITRENASAPWTLAETKSGQEFDANKAGTIASILSNLYFADVLSPDAPAAETGLDAASVLTATTFDGITYELQFGKLMGENYPVVVSVKGQLPKERTPGPDEKPEDKEKLDQQFQATQKTLADKLAKEEKLAGRPYLIPKSTTEQLLQERSALLKPPPTPSPTPANKKK